MRCWDLVGYTQFNDAKTQFLVSFYQKFIHLSAGEEEMAGLDDGWGTMEAPNPQLEISKYHYNVAETFCVAFRLVVSAEVSLYRF